MDSPQQSTVEFEDWLSSTGRQFVYPPTPSLAEEVTHRLRQHQAEGQRSYPASVLSRLLPDSPAVRAAGAALVLVAIIMGIAVGLFPPVRTAMAEFFGLQRIEVVPIDGPPPSSPLQRTPSGFEGVAGATTLAEAQSKANFPIRFPTYPEDLEGPDPVYFQDLQPGQQVILVYLSQPEVEASLEDEDGVLFTLFQFETEGVFQKQIFPETLVEELEVGESKALWFQGAAHFLQYRDDDGELSTQVRRLVEGNTLAWEVGDVTYRLETWLPKEEAIKIAESLR